MRGFNGVNIKGKCRKRIIKRMCLEKAGLDRRRRNEKQRETQVDVRVRSLIMGQLNPPKLS